MKSTRISLQILLPVIAVLFYHPFLDAQIKKDTTVVINHRSVTLHFPAGPAKGTILMLPGWNFSKDKTCESSSFCEKALKDGFVLICPEMGKSVYASAAFPNTRKDWAVYPQLKFITDTLQVFVLKTFHLLNKGGRNYVYGISTGARGGALILENTTEIYKCGALLSGDYDQTLDTADNLMKGYYGSYVRFRERWEGIDNPAKHIDRIHVPVYIGHGRTDKVVPPAQSVQFNALLKKAGISSLFSYRKNCGHDYVFWGSETESVLAFFNSH